MLHLYMSPCKVVETKSPAGRQVRKFTGYWVAKPARGGEGEGSAMSPEDEAAMEAEARRPAPLQTARERSLSAFSCGGEEALCRRGQGTALFPTPCLPVSAVSVPVGSTLVWPASFNGHRLPGRPGLSGTVCSSLQSGAVKAGTGRDLLSSARRRTADSDLGKMAQLDFRLQAFLLAIYDEDKQHERLVRYYKGAGKP